jgi:hypothetical protein
MCIQLETFLFILPFHLSYSMIKDRCSFFSSAGVVGVQSWRWAWLAAFVIQCGCGSTEIPVYVARKDVATLPGKHQSEIASYLEKFFGTPLRPMLRVTADSESAVEGENTELKLVDKVDPKLLMRGREVYVQQ